MPNHAQSLSSQSPEWYDELVQLHVLAESGDTVAAATAERWINSDADARKVWEDVERTCDRVRADALPTSAN
ncbi:MAG: hypothetical protein QOI50_3074 [Pseudonocardiales bacterium]|jgi:hypothetical protein|uniref:hypothetical protein n=1 Tax=Pseudonocardia sp. Cha107L01 TaxID=3457576 RepID=UPI0028C8EF9D|nr:hypothetical protein [Pseudonocardiales bacterium]MDT7589374.1 hypothetical protein [Pseudonocardiales bacterium]MDT7593488.1 hypothetical protein [Pseudonocardiales bacterium]MDT7607415.1 hypothetical protein [Pseudonocardiales bacterium]MDT7619522.1 hypothetical protein [Pseudonocardiales bacterium]